MTPDQRHEANVRLAKAALKLVVEDTLKGGGDWKDVLGLLETVTAAAFMLATDASHDAAMIEKFSGNVGRRLANLRAHKKRNEQ